MRAIFAVLVPVDAAELLAIANFTPIPPPLWEGIERTDADACRRHVKTDCESGSTGFATRRPRLLIQTHSQFWAAVDKCVVLSPLVVEFELVMSHVAFESRLHLGPSPQIVLCLSRDVVVRRVQIERLVRLTERPSSSL